MHLLRGRMVCAREAEQGGGGSISAGKYLQLIAASDLKTFHLVARVLEIAKKCSSCGDMNRTASS